MPQHSVGKSTDKVAFSNICQLFVYIFQLYVYGLRFFCLSQMFVYDLNFSRAKPKGYAIFFGDFKLLLISKSL